MGRVILVSEVGEARRARVQRRTLRLLFGTQIAGGIGTTIGVSVGGLLAARLGGTDVSGLAQSCAVVGGALLAVPVSRVMRARGRRPGLAMAYAVGAGGAALVVLAAATRQVWLLFLGMLAFGGGTAANLQARYSAVDLSPADRRGRQMSVIVWATTIGAVVAPNFADPSDRLLHRLGAPSLAGPFVVSIVVFALAATVITLFLRPDPLLTARVLAGTDAISDVARRRAGGMRAAWRAITASPSARLAIVAVATGHLVMVGVMSMTPVHIGMMGGMHGDADILRLVGIVLSLHVAGMYALSPLVGLAVDRFGRRAVIVAGVVVLLAACFFSGTSGESRVRLAVGLVLLGFGWSCMIVAGSTMLTESVGAEVRPAAQGLSDLVMGIAGASSGALSGLVVSGPGYPTLTVLAAIATVPLLGLALRTDSGSSGPGGAAGRVEAATAPALVGGSVTGPAAGSVAGSVAGSAVEEG
jgi:MFS family permease